MQSHNKFLCRYPTNDAPLFYGRGISLAGQKVKQDHNKEQGSAWPCTRASADDFSEWKEVVYRRPELPWNKFKLLQKI